MSRFRNLTQSNRDMLLLFSLALGLRLAWALLAPQIDPFLRFSPLHGDAAAYDRIIRSLLSGTGYTEFPPGLSSFWPPLYPLFMRVLYGVVGYNQTVGRLVQAFFGAFVPVSIYWIGQKFYSRPVALLAAVGLVVYPYLVYFGAWLIAEAFFMGLLAVALWLAAWISGRWSPWQVAFWGLLLGACALAKPTTLFIAPFLAAWLFLAPRSMSILKRLGLVGLLTVTTLAAILPWTARNYLVHGEFVLISINGAYTLLGANNPNAWGGHDEGYPELLLGLSEVEMADVYTREAQDWMRSSPGDFLKLLPVKYRRLFSPLSVASQRQDYPLPGAFIVYAGYGVFLLLALVGIGLSLRNWRQVGFLYAPILGVLISTGLFYGDTRYTLPMVPSLVLFAALAAISGYGLIRNNGR